MSQPVSPLPGQPPEPESKWSWLVDPPKTPAEMAGSAIFVILFLMYHFGWIGDGFIGFLVIVGLIVLYFAPTCYAIARTLDGTTILFVVLVNLLVGWTIIGWLLCFIWVAVAKPIRDRT